MNFKFSKNDGKKKNIPQLKKESSNSFCKIDSFKKKQKRLIHLFGEKCLILWCHGGSTMSSRCKAKQRQVTKQESL